MLRDGYQELERLGNQALVEDIDAPDARFKDLAEGFLKGVRQTVKATPDTGMYYLLLMEYADAIRHNLNYHRKVVIPAPGT